MECERQRSKVKTILLQCFALYKFQVTDGQNMRDQMTSERRSKRRDQIPLCAFHTFLVEVQTNTGYIYATHA